MISNVFRRHARRPRGVRSAASVVALTAALAGCSSIGGLTTGSTSAPTPAPTTTAAAPPAAASSSNTSFTSRVKQFFTGDAGTTLAAAPATPGAAAPDINCPTVDYRQGAATFAVNAPNTENAALSLRYQASFAQTARECLVRGSDLTIKVGVQGRVVLGPAGGPGPINLPLRYALIREGIEPKTIWTKLYTIPVTIPDGQLNVPFVHVEEEMTVPMPSSAELDAYVVYIGFDPNGLAPAEKPKPVTRKPARAKS